MKTENLAILFTDIVGYTEKTSNISREAHESLMAAHDRILLPVLKKFRGKLIQRIGDAFLMVFKSPTDAMLCGMAMQDAVFEFNQNVKKDAEIHIRVAASLGEVRVAQKDIFGEQVNITARIESITPPDEIYFSDAIYMAMNKAEVPTEEVGWMRFKGIADKCRVWKIPQFSNLKLVPTDKINVDESMPSLTFPFGGAHKRDPVSGQSDQSFFDKNKQIKVGLYAILGLLVLALPIVFFSMDKGPDKPLSTKSQQEKLLSTDIKETGEHSVKDEQQDVVLKTEAELEAKVEAEPEPEVTNIASALAPEQSNTNKKTTPIQIKPNKIQKSDPTPVSPHTQQTVQEPPPATLSLNAPSPQPVKKQTQLVEKQSQPVKEQVQPVKNTEPVLSEKKIDPEIAKWRSKILSSDPAQIREGGKYVYKIRGGKTELIPITSKALLSGFTTAEGRIPVDAMAWLCKAIGASGDRRYISTLDKVARETTQPRLKRHAISSMILMEKLDYKNGTINKSELSDRIRAIQKKYASSG